MDLTVDNLYYDENGLLYLKDRDIYGRGEKPNDLQFVNAYKSFVAGVLGSKYSVTQIQESGIEICKDENGLSLSIVVRQRKRLQISFGK